MPITKNSNYKILLITTKGCEGCNIAIKNAKEAINQSKKQIVLDIKDRSEVSQEERKSFIKPLKDFPTTVYIKNGVCKYMQVGTYPIAVVLRYIDIFFR